VSKKEKLLERISSKPKDFTWIELVSLMTALGFDTEKSSGSGRKFILEATGGVLFIHQPHPAKILKPYQVRDAVDLLEKEGFLR
jgi:hypothetical protein